MPGSTPLLGVAYPLGSEAPDGAAQMETLARGLEKYGVIVAANSAARDALITPSLRHDGTMCWLSSTNELQVYDGSAWQTAYTAGDLPLQRRNDLGTASSYPNGSLVSRSSDDTLWLNIGTSWLRILDGGDVGQGTSTIDQSSQQTTSVNGETKAGVWTEVTVPDSGKLMITVSAQMKNSTNTQPTFFGFQVDDGNGNGSWWAFNKQRAARVTRDEYMSASWTAIVNVGHAGQVARVWGMHAVADNNYVGYFIAREVLAVPVR